MDAKFSQIKVSSAFLYNLFFLLLLLIFQCKSSFRNGHLSSENLGASAEAAVADQLPPGAHPVDLRSATSSPPLQNLLESTNSLPSPPPPTPQESTNKVINRQQHLQLPIDGTRMIQLSPTVILRQVEVEKRPPDVKKPEIESKTEKKELLGPTPPTSTEIVSQTVISEEPQVRLPEGKFFFCKKFLNFDLMLLLTFKFIKFALTTSDCVFCLILGLKLQFKSHILTLGRLFFAIQLNN